MKKIVINTVGIHQYRKIKHFSVLILFLLSLSTSYSQSGWIHQEIGTRKYLVVSFVNNTTGFLLSEDKTILKTTNLGQSWNMLPPNISNPRPVKGGKFLNDSTMALLLTNEIYYSTNSGSNWNYFLLPSIGNGFVFLSSIEILNAYTGYVCGADFGVSDRTTFLDGVIFKTINAGANWFQSFRGGSDYNNIKFKDDLIGYVTQYSIIKTTDGGNFWDLASELTSNTFSISNIFNDTLFVSCDSGKIYRSINAGVNWTMFYTPTNDTLRKIFFVNSKVGYAIGDLGLIVKTTNAGVNWALQNSGTTRRLRDIYFINEDTGFVVGDSGIVLKTYTGGLTSILNESIESPDRFFLYQNYPNPFNPSTNIKFDIPKAENVELKVYNVLGKEVASLIEGFKPRGSYSIELNATSLSSGIYYYKLNAGEFWETKKMLILK